MVHTHNNIAQADLHCNNKGREDVKHQNPIRIQKKNEKKEKMK